jgi:hypothetical protein
VAAPAAKQGIIGKKLPPQPRVMFFWQTFQERPESGAAGSGESLNSTSVETFSVGRTLRGNGSHD